VRRFPEPVAHRLGRDADGDGFIEYSPKTGQGLANQGWKDSWDGINFADGRTAQAPIALAEVQGYGYAAYRARAAFAREAGDAPRARHWDSKAAQLKRAFNQAFWLPGKGWFAVALDRDKRPVDALTSNIGHCLWTGIADADKAAAVADRLLSDDMFSGWGITPGHRYPRRRLGPHRPGRHRHRTRPEAATLPRHRRNVILHTGSPLNEPRARRLAQRPGPPVTSHVRLNGIGGVRPTGPSYAGRTP
jgi:hypothetical protein